MANSYTWTATGSGSWSTVSNWFDITAGTPATASPEPADAAEIDNPGTGTITVTGPADVLDLSVSGQVTLAGNYTIGSLTLGVPPFDPSFFGPTLVSTIALSGSFVVNSLNIGDLHGVPGFPSDQVADYGLVEVDSGSMLSASSGALNSGDLRVDGGAVSIGKDLFLGIDLAPGPGFPQVVPVTAGSLDVSNHGNVRLVNLSIIDGEVSLDATSTLEIGGAGTATAGTITIDPGAYLEEGDPISSIESPIRAAETIQISDPILNNGNLYTDQNVSDVINNGTIFFQHSALSFISGNGQIFLDEDGTIGPGVSGTLNFIYGETIDIALGTGVPIDGTDTPPIANFGTGITFQTIVVQGITADTAIYTATGPGIGTLALDNGTTQVASLTMLGTYASGSFQVVSEAGDSVVTPTQAPDSSFTWTAGSGDWTSADNWFDETNGLPALDPPSVSDTAEVDNPGTGAITVAGPASVATLWVSGDVTLAGTYTAGDLLLGIPPASADLPLPSPGSTMPTLTGTVALAGNFDIGNVTIGFSTLPSPTSTPNVVDYGVVRIEQGTSLSAQSLALASGVLIVDGGTVDLSGEATLGTVYTADGGISQIPVASGTLDVLDHAIFQTGELLFQYGSINLDATSALEIGGTGNAAAGTITVDPDGILLVGMASATGSFSAISAPVVNNGTIEAFSDLSDAINNGTIYVAGATLSHISGNGGGQIIFGAGSTIGPGVGGTLEFGSYVGTATTSYGGTIDIALGAGVPINGTDTPKILNFSTIVGAPGFTSDQIVLQGISADTATYTPTDTGIGTLTLDNGNSRVASLTMLGTYPSDAFIVTPGTGDSVVTLRSPTADSYTWAAAGSGDWGSASNWFDVTSGMAAVAVPGPAATAVIDNPATGTITVTGPADVLNLSVSGDVTLAGSDTIGSFTLAVPPFNPSFFEPTLVSTIALAGSFAASSLDIGDLHGVPGFPSAQVADFGLIAVGQGAMLSAGTVAVRSGDLLVDGGALSIGNSLTLGTIFLAPSFPPLNFFMTAGVLEDLNHGSVELGSLVIADGGVSLDATSTLEIGNAGTATAGTITVDPGADLEFGVPFSFAGVVTQRPTLAIAGPVLNNGDISTNTDLSHVINNGKISVTLPNFGTHPTLSFISGNGQIELASIGEPFTIGSGVSGTLDLDHVPEVIFSLGTGVPIDVSDTPRIANFGLDGNSDTIVLNGISADTATYTPTGTGIGTLTLENGSTEVATLTILGTYASNAFSVAAGSGDTALSLNPPCFGAGTRIATPRGEMPVEALCSGDEVTLASGGTASIVWIGRRRVDCRSHPEPHQVWPVRIGRGAFAPGVPHRDLLLSPDHAVFVDGVLIPIKYLLNRDTIRQVARDAVVYFHLELPAHDVVLADGLAVESYLDTGDRNSFENAGGVVSLFPTFSSLAWEAYGYAPLVVTGPEVDAARRRIEMRARDLAVARPQRRRHGIA